MYCEISGAESFSALKEDLHDEEEGKRGGTENQDKKTNVKMVEEAQDSLLHKYMLMVMQGRESEREQVHTCMHTHTVEDTGVCGYVYSADFFLSEHEERLRKPES